MWMWIEPIPRWTPAGPPNPNVINAEMWMVIWSRRKFWTTWTKPRARAIWRRQKILKIINKFDGDWWFFRHFESTKSKFSRRIFVSSQKWFRICISGCRRIFNLQKPLIPVLADPIRPSNTMQRSIPRRPSTTTMWTSVKFASWDHTNIWPGTTSESFRCTNFTKSDRYFAQSTTF